MSLRALCAALPLVFGAAPGIAQDTDETAGPTGGALVTLDLSFGYTYEDDDGEPTDSFFGTRFDLGVFSETRNQRLSLSVGALGELDGDRSEFIDITGALGYSVFNRDTEASVDLSFREADVDDDVDEDFDEDTLSATSGTRQTHGAALRLITGRTARFGTETELSYEEIDYADTTDPDLVPETVHSASTTLRFSVSRQVDLRLFGSWTETERVEAPLEIETATRFGVGGTFLIDRAWTASADLAWVEIETDTGGPVAVSDGLELDLMLTRALPNGTLAFSASREVTETADIDSFSVTREMALSGGGQLSASAGIVSFENGDVLPAFGLAYENEVLRGGTVTASLTQEGAVNGDDENIFRTRFDIAYRHELTPTSFLSLSGSLASVDVQGGASADTERASIGLAYGHDLTRDWSLVGRADHSVVYENGARTDRTNRISINLERSFSFRP